MNYTKIRGVHPDVLAGKVAVQPVTAANHRGAMIYLESIGIDCSHGDADSWLRAGYTTPEFDSHYSRRYKYKILNRAIDWHCEKPVMQFSEAFLVSRAITTLK